MIRTNLNIWAFLAAAVVVGCTGGELETVRSELAIEGPWAPPAELVAQANAYDITFVSAGPWVGSSGCSPGFTEGGATFRQWLYDHWPQVEHVGGYACRAINGDSSTMSVHATGRAVDIHIPLDGGSADNDLGDAVANWLLAHADEIGIQSIIWDRWIWSPSRSPRSRPYTGAHAHHDHLHVELTPAASRLETPWFQGEMGPPEIGGCDDPMSTEGGVIDDADACFQAFGPAAYWRRVDDAGVDGGLRWTNAFQTEDPSNWGRWRINLAEGGTYRVEYHSVAEYAVFGSTHYGVKFGDQVEDVYVDQGAGGDGWVVLGEWDFAAGADQWVAIYDDHGGAVGDEQHVMADAIRLTRPPAGGDVVVPSPPTTPTESAPPRPPAESDAVDENPRSIHGEGGCSAVDGGTPSTWSLLVAFGLIVARRRRD